MVLSSLLFSKHNENQNKIGNKLVEIPDSIGVLICLEKLSISNNQIQRISDQIGRLSKLEELNLNGNPLSTIPKGLGCCISMEVFIKQVIFFF